MKPGRELDALVAEKVMGWRLEERGYGATFWVDENGKVKRAAEPCSIDFCSCEVFSPSTDISDAWEVVEKLRDLGFHVGIKTPPKVKSCSYWVCLENFYAGKSFTEYGETAPLAICMAALKALGMEVE
jgi:hypothetical protein